LARLRDSIPVPLSRGAEMSPSQSTLVRQRIAEWIQDVDASGRSVIQPHMALCPVDEEEVVCQETPGGEVLVRVLFVLAHALETVQVR
jgi:hypothetical protein